ncbi:MAG: signal peptidase II [Mycobacteriales bacterium]
MTKPRALLVLFALLTVAADVATKLLVVAQLEGREPVRLLGGLVTFRVSRNSGAAFSFAEGATVVFTLIAVAVVVVIVRTMPRLRSTGWAVTLGLLLGGATGNLIDRLARAPGVGRGAVVDFISLPHFATFNVADSAITVGAALAVLLSLRGVEVDGSRRT